MTVAILGCGAIGAVHADAVRRVVPGARLAFADADAAAARTLAATFRGVAWTDVDALLARERPTIVHVCTPPATHAALAARVLASGAAVLVEKPLALTTPELALVARELRTRPGALGVDHNYLFEPAMLRARRWVGEGWIGRVVAAEMVQGVDATADGGWRSRLPGGRTTDLLPHGLYCIRHFLGDVRGVAGRAANGGTEIGAVLECERGLGTVRVSLTSAPWELVLVIRGTAGTIRVDLARQRAVLERAFADRRRPVALVRGAAGRAWWTGLGVAERFAGKASGRLRGYPGLRTLVARFHEAVRTGAPPPVGFDDGAAVVAVLERVRHRLEEPRPELAVARRRIA